MAVFFLAMAGLNLALGFAIAWFLAPEVRIEVVYLPVPVAAAPPEPQSEPQPQSPPEPAAVVAAAPVPAAPIAEPPAAPVAEETAGQDAPAPAVDATIADFKRELSRYRDQLASLDKRMRHNSETQDAAAIQQCLTDLRSANNEYLEQQSSATTRIQNNSAAPELAPLNRQLGEALEEQAAAVQRSNSQLANVDVENDLLDSCQKMLDETSRLVDANHTMRDVLHEVELELARRGQAPPEAEAEDDQAHSPLMSRTQLEAVLGQWWQANPDHKRPLSVGLIDVDRFRELNDSQGLEVGDSVLEAIGTLVAASARGNHRGARMSAQKFLLMFPDLPAREATTILEKLRQQVEVTQFKRGEATLSTTVSCAVVQASDDDALTAMLDRVEATLQEAKRYGRNRTFLHDGKFPAPVVPPVLTIENRTMSV